MSIAENLLCEEYIKVVTRNSTIQKINYKQLEAFHLYLILIILDLL